MSNDQISSIDQRPTRGAKPVAPPDARHPQRRLKKAGSAPGQVIHQCLGNLDSGLREHQQPFELAHQGRSGDEQDVERRILR
jgi:hypothetical protein